MHPPTPSEFPERGQPEDGWLRAELVKYDDSRACEHLRRLAADIELRDRLMFAGFAGREWERFARACIAYAHPILFHRIRTGKISWHCRRKRAPGAPWPMPLLSVADTDDLVQELLALAIIKFRSDVLIKARWRPDRGASLTTYFVGKCLLLFPTVFRNWCVRFVEPGPRIALDMQDLPSRMQADEGWLDRRRCLAVALAPDDPTDSAIVRLTALGYTAREIADELAVNVKTVETRIHRYRGRHAKH
jgi:hypothetical protein